MSYIVVLDYLIFSYWYEWANRYTVLNFQETAFLPARYIISGLVAGAFVYWLYLIPLWLLKRLWPRYQHPRWPLLWGATAVISSLQVWLIVRNSEPALEVWPSLALIVHLQLLHSVMLMVADRALRRGLASILPGLRSALILMAIWIFWAAYSFFPPPPGNPQPLIGSELERLILILILGLLIQVGLAYRLGSLRGSWADGMLIPPLRISSFDALDAFYTAWACFFLSIPVGQYLSRGYVITHSNLFPAFLLGLLLPMIWSLLGMWLIILISKITGAALLQNESLQRLRDLGLRRLNG
jgi:hypothetical protein